MISKWKINLIAFLISMTLFSVGFSSWQITSKFVEIANGTITTDSVIPAPDDVSQLVTIDEVECFKFNSLGIVHLNADGTYKETNYTATVTAHITLYPQALKAHFKDHGVTKLALDATLTYSGTTVGLFKDTYTYAPSSSLDALALGFTSTSHSTKSYTFSTKLETILSDNQDSRSLTMNFTFTMSESEYEDFYTAIINAIDFKFDVSANLSVYADATT